MPFRMRYTVWVDFVPQGVGLGQQAGTSAAVGPVMAGQGQTLEVNNNKTALLPPVTATFLSADVTTLTNAMAADISAQLNLAPNLAQVQAFASGGN